jgi:cyclopropane fatty-acyl-phospholipid synthase-like methyltransferase
VERLDPYAFMAVIGKRIIHPGGRRSTEELFRFADFRTGQRILDIGAGVGTTAIDVAARFGCETMAVDIDPLMLSRADANVRAAGVGSRVVVEKGDIQSLRFPDGSFDTVMIEAVTMFVDRAKAAQEAVRVCRPNGLVIDHEFIYRRPPTPEVRRIFEGEVCPGIRFDTAEDWIAVYRVAGLSDIQHVTGPFEMMTPIGMLRDEGIPNLVVMMGRILARRAYLRKMGWLMSRILRVRSYLGYVVLAGKKPLDPVRAVSNSSHD